MSVLGKSELVALLKHDNPAERLIITPLLDYAQVGNSSIDLRLGNDFIVTQKGNLAYVDPALKNNQQQRCHKRHYVNFNHKFYLHPGELVLAATLEYIRLPNSHFAFVASRSSWGRMGLIIATAISIAPGFTGTITLELENLGEVPLVLYPGINIAQLVVQDCRGGDAYSGKFSCFTGPECGDVSKDKNLEFFC